MFLSCSYSSSAYPESFASCWTKMTSFLFLAAKADKLWVNYQHGTVTAVAVEDTTIATVQSSSSSTNRVRSTGSRGLRFLIDTGPQT
jgi:hypothetical protein